MAEKKNFSFLEHCLIIGGGTIVSMVISLISTPIITRLVLPDTYGQLSIFNLYTSMAVMVLCLGLDQALIRFFYQYDTNVQRKQVFQFCTFFPVILSSICLAAVGVACLYTKKSFFSSTSVTIFLIVNIIVNLLYRFALMLLRITYNSKQYTAANLIFRTVFVCAALICCGLLNYRGIEALAFATVLGYGVATIYAISIKHDFWFPFERISRSGGAIARRNILKYGIPQILALGLTTLFQALDKLFLNYYCDYAEVGIYSSAMTLVNIFAIIQTSFNSMWAPKQVEHYEQNPEDKEFYQKINAIITFLMFFVGIHLILFKNVFAILLGEAYREAAYIIPFLAFNPIMLTISETTCGGIAFKKKASANIWISAGACVVNACGNAILVPLYGARGAAISTGVSYVVFWALRTFVSNCFYPVDYHSGKMLILTAAACGYAWYNTFHQFDVFVIFEYICCVLLLVIFYRDAVRELLDKILKKHDWKDKNWKKWIKMNFII